MRIDQAHVVATNISTGTNNHHNQGGTLNVVGVSNAVGDARPKTEPSLTLLHNDGRKENLEFSSIGFDRPVQNGVISNGRFKSDIVEKYTQEKISPDQCLVKDGALSLNIPRTRIHGGDMTKTQKILNDYIDGRPVDLSKLIHDDEKVDLDREARLKMVNDPTRRVFESYYAKYALEKIFSDPGVYGDMYALSTQQTDYVKKNFCTPEVTRQFELACKGEDFSFDSQLGGFYERINKTIDTLSISDVAKSKLTEIYLNRYLNLALRNDKEVSGKMPDGHWDQIFDHFKAPGKGRVEIKVEEGDMFRQADSHAVGVLRNFDASPTDLRLNEPYQIKYSEDYNGKLTAGKSTRCPDRLEIQDPMHPDAFKENSYVNGLFEEGVGTYINGPSGTILIEQGAIRACKDIHNERSAEDISRYLELQGLLFIYVDGGHSMLEISSALTNEAVSEKMANTFDQQPGFKQIGQEMFKDKTVLERAAKDAAIFNRSLHAKDALHKKLLSVTNRHSA